MLKTIRREQWATVQTGDQALTFGCEPKSPRRIRQIKAVWKLLHGQGNSPEWRDSLYNGGNICTGYGTSSGLTGNLAVPLPGISASCPSHKLSTSAFFPLPRVVPHSLSISNPSRGWVKSAVGVEDIIHFACYPVLLWANPGFLEECSPPLPPDFCSGHTNQQVPDSVLNPVSLCVWFLSPHSNQIEQVSNIRTIWPQLPSNS